MKVGSSAEVDCTMDKRNGYRGNTAVGMGGGGEEPCINI